MDSLLCFRVSGFVLDGTVVVDASWLDEGSRSIRRAKVATCVEIWELALT